MGRSQAAGVLELVSDDVSFFIFWNISGWEKRWIQSTNKGESAGKFVLTHGKFYGDAEKDLGKT